jgi:hypothetical protein
LIFLKVKLAEDNPKARYKTKSRLTEREFPVL